MQEPSVADNKPLQKRWPRWVKITLLVFAVPLALAAWLLVERHRAKAALAKYEKELIDKGEKLTFAELIPPPPEGENATPEFLRLVKSLQEGTTLVLNSPPAMRLVAPAKAMVMAKEQKWSSRGETNIFRWSDVETDIAQNTDILAQLREVARSPILRSTVQHRGINTRLPHLAPAKSAAQWLSASALYNVHIGDSKAAITDIETIILLCRIFRDEPTLLSQLVRNAIVSIAIHNCWPILQLENISEQQLARLQKLFSDLDLVDPMIQAARGERILGRETIHMLRSTDTSFETVADTLASFSEDDEESVMEKMPYDDEVRGFIRTAVVAPLWRFVWSYEDEWRLLEEVQAIVVTAEQAKFQRSVSVLKTLANSIDKRTQRSWRYSATDVFTSITAKGPLRAFRYQAHREMTVTAIALKRYYLRHGKYPKTRDELVPEFLSTHPIDWMDGQNSATVSTATHLCSGPSATTVRMTAVHPTNPRLTTSLPVLTSSGPIPLPPPKFRHIMRPANQSHDSRALTKPYPTKHCIT